MSTRPLALPQDFVSVAEVLGRTFQYPDHPEWSLDFAEQEQAADAIQRMRRAWPAVRVLQCVSSAMRDLMRGFVWEEHGTLGGFVAVQRDGQTTMWQVEPLGILPEFRRRGIARQLMTEALTMIRSRGGTGVRLGVIDGNAPAQALYRSLGFVDYGGSTLYELAPTACERPTLANVYEELPLAKFDWRTRCEMDQRIVPAGTQEFEAIVPARYRTPWLMRALAPFYSSMRGHDILIRRTRDHVAVARAGWSVTKSGKGKNSIRIRLDPAHADLAPYLVRRVLHELFCQSPNLPVEFFLPLWVPDVAREAEALGFVRRRTNRMMGMKF